MRISPTQLATGPGTSGGAEAGRPTRAADSPRTVSTGGTPPGRAGSDSSGAKLSTTLRIDDQHYIYYEIIDDQSGDVVLEIPPEQIRKLAEGLSKSLAADGETHSLDVKS